MIYLLGIIFCVFSIYFFYKAHKNTKDVVLNNITVSHSKLMDKPLNILHLSDLHLENISISPEELYQTVSNQKIDLIALTGDFLDRKRSIPKLVPYLSALSRLNPRFGMYAVYGNHDYF